MHLSKWAKLNGVNYRTAQRWFKAGKLPVSARKTPNGIIIIEDVVDQDVVIYARSNPDADKSELERQMSRCREYALENKLDVVKSVSESVSLFDSKRTALCNLVADWTVRTILVENKSVFGFFLHNLISKILSASGRRLLVVDNSEHCDAEMQYIVDYFWNICVTYFSNRDLSLFLNFVKLFLEKAGFDVLQE